MSERETLKNSHSAANSAVQSERIAKRIARSGLCSRRDAERWIGEGRVTLNGRLLVSPAVAVTAEDLITVDGKPLAEQEATRLWLFHKKRGFVTTNKDPEGRATVFEALPETLPRVMTVGRLDINTEGLLLLTNDGGLARVLELPKTGWSRRYRVRVHGRITQQALDELKQGITVEGIAYGPIEAAIERAQGTNLWLTMVLREGKNREIKNILGALGLQVTRLIRVSFGPFQLGDLTPGAVQEVKRRILKDQLGQKLAAEAGIDLSRDLGANEQPVPAGKRAKRQSPGRKLAKVQPKGTSRADRRRPS